MNLRQWQTECVNSVLNKYRSGRKHFLCLATPGSGKTIMAAEVASKLLQADRIDYILCFSPSAIIARDIRYTFESRIDKRFDGIVGSNGGSYTYQNMRSLDSKIWNLLKTHRVLAVFDEVHHCSGNHYENANAWGEEIIKHIQHFASYTLALTGTPWRSDNTPIVLAEYTDDDNSIICDFAYGLLDAINDGVCRVPQIVVTDNSNILVKEGKDELKYFKSFVDLLERTQCPYQQIVENVSILKHLLTEANTKLRKIREINSSAGGLIVASSVDHAKMIFNILRNELDEEAVIATYRESESLSIINDFKSNNIPWIVSVGMVSEGTNIPRLQVCCHLTRIKTELHFRQVLGRILRISNDQNQEAYMFMPAESRLIEFAYRVAEDIPYENSVVKFEGISDLKTTIYFDGDENRAQTHRIESNHQIEFENDLEFAHCSSSSNKNMSPILTKSYEAIINVYGQFKQEILKMNTSPFD